MVELHSDTRAAGQAEPGYETEVEKAAQGLADEGPAGAAVLVQGANRGGSDGAHGWPGHGYGSLGGGGGGGGGGREGFWNCDRK